LFKGAREHINKIRLKKYWIDENGYLKKGRNPLSSDLMDSIKHLSDGLYSSNVHFIFELIQNAEDNTYPHNTKPSLSFHLVQKDPTETKGSDGALIIHNNELGFSPENIEAICAIGKSTKKKNQGYIGEKVYR
jgi:HSP90 family molecular chaperone